MRLQATARDGYSAVSRVASIPTFSATSTANCFAFFSRVPIGSGRSHHIHTSCATWMQLPGTQESKNISMEIPCHLSGRDIGSSSHELTANRGQCGKVRQYDIADDDRCLTHTFTYGEAFAFGFAFQRGRWGGSNQRTFESLVRAWASQ